MSVRHEVFNAAELQPTPGGEELAPIVSLLTREQISATLADSQARLSSIESLQASIQGQIVKIDNQLRPDIIKDKVRVIKEGAQSGIDSNMKAIRANADLAKAQERFWTPQAVRLRASFDNDPAKDATIATAWMMKIEKLEAVFLVEMAALAASTGNLALARLIEAEVSYRNSDSNAADRRIVNIGHRGEIMRFIDSIPSASAEVMQTLAEIQHLVGIAGMAASGHSNSVERIKQGIRAGGLKAPNPLGL